MTYQFIVMKSSWPEEGLTEEAALHRIHHLQQGVFPARVFADRPFASPWLPKGAEVRVQEEMDLGSVFAYLVGVGQDCLLVLPEALYRALYRDLVGGKPGRRLAFAVSVSISDLKTEPQWYLRDDGKIRLPATVTTGGDPAQAIKSILLKKEDKIEGSFLKLFQDSEDIEAVHKIRVNARTLRSLLDFLKPWTDRELNRAMRVQLRDLARDFSDIREQDVLREHMADFVAEDPNRLAHYQAIDGFIGESRQKAMAGLLMGAISENRLAVIPELRVDLNALDIQGENLAHDINQRYYNDWIDFQVRADLHDYLDVEGTHDIRKEAKRMRYVLENFGPWIPSVDDDMALHFKEIQTVLGDLCDARTNQTMLDGLPEAQAQTWSEDAALLFHHHVGLEMEILQDLGLEPEAGDLANSAAETVAPQAPTETAAPEALQAQGEPQVQEEPQAQRETPPEASASPAPMQEASIAPRTESPLTRPASQLPSEGEPPAQE